MMNKLDFLKLNELETLTGLSEAEFREIKKEINKTSFLLLCKFSKKCNDNNNSIADNSKEMIVIDKLPEAFTTKQFLESYIFQTKQSESTAKRLLRKLVENKQIIKDFHGMYRKIIVT
jgi:hypothetical protein